MSLTPEILLTAYAQGIFPMAPARGSSEIKWYEPDPRAVLKLDTFHASRRLMRTFRSGQYQFTHDKDFAAVIRACADARDETWINDEIIAAYAELHRLGHAHSVEVWRASELVGGLYGVSVPGGRVFAGESMFSRATDASKCALVYLVEWLKSQGFTYLDAQFQTPHLEQFGFEEIRQAEYQKLLQCTIR